LRGAYLVFWQGYQLLCKNILSDCSNHKKNSCMINHKQIHIGKLLKQEVEYRKIDNQRICNFLNMIQ